VATGPRSATVVQVQSVVLTHCEIGSGQIAGDDVEVSSVDCRTENDGLRCASVVAVGGRKAQSGEAGSSASWRGELRQVGNARSLQQFAG
jgi:hypothetical protein